MPHFSDEYINSIVDQIKKNPAVAPKGLEVLFEAEIAELVRQRDEAKNIFNWFRKDNAMQLSTHQRITVATFLRDTRENSSLSSWGLILLGTSILLLDERHRHIAVSSFDEVIQRKDDLSALAYYFRGEIYQQGYGNSNLTNAAICYYESFKLRLAEFKRSRGQETHKHINDMANKLDYLSKQGNVKAGELYLQAVKDCEGVLFLDEHIEVILKKLRKDPGYDGDDFQNIFKNSNKLSDRQKTLIIIELEKPKLEKLSEHALQLLAEFAEISNQKNFAQRYYVEIQRRNLVQRTVDAKTISGAFEGLHFDDAYINTILAEIKANPAAAEPNSKLKEVYRGEISRLKINRDNTLAFLYEPSCPTLTKNQRDNFINVLGAIAPGQLSSVALLALGAVAVQNSKLSFLAIRSFDEVINRKDNFSASAFYYRAEMYELGYGGEVNITESARCFYGSFKFQLSRFCETAEERVHAEINRVYGRIGYFAQNGNEEAKKLLEKALSDCDGILFLDSYLAEILKKLTQNPGYEGDDFNKVFKNLDKLNQGQVKSIEAVLAKHKIEKLSVCALLLLYRFACKHPQGGLSNLYYSEIKRRGKLELLSVKTNELLSKSQDSKNITVSSSSEQSQKQPEIKQGEVSVDSNSFTLHELLPPLSAVLPHLEPSGNSFVSQKSTDLSLAIDTNAIAPIPVPANTLFFDVSVPPPPPYSPTAIQAGLVTYSQPIHYASVAQPKSEISPQDSSMLAVPAVESPVAKGKETQTSISGKVATSSSAKPTTIGSKPVLQFSLSSSQALRKEAERLAREEHISEANKLLQIEKASDAEKLRRAELEVLRKNTAQVRVPQNNI